MDARSIVTPEERAALLTDDLPKLAAGSDYVPLDIGHEPDPRAERHEELAMAHTETIIGRPLTDPERMAFRLGFARGAMFGCELAHTIASEMLQRKP